MKFASCYSNQRQSSLMWATGIMHTKPELYFHHHLDWSRINSKTTSSPLLFSPLSVTVKWLHEILGVRSVWKDLLLCTSCPQHFTLPYFFLMVFFCIMHIWLSERGTTGSLIKGVIRILVLKLIWTTSSHVFYMFAGVLNFVADQVPTCICTYTSLTCGLGT